MFRMERLLFQTLLKNGAREKKQRKPRQKRGAHDEMSDHTLRISGHSTDGCLPHARFQ